MGRGSSKAGNRGSSRAGGGGGVRNAISEKAYSKKVYNEILSKGLNSKFPGIRAKAEEGTGNYSFKGAQAVGYDQAMKMKSASMKALTRGENTLIDGELPNGKHVYFAGKTESPHIQVLLEKRKSKVDTTPNLPDIS